MRNKKGAVREEPHPIVPRGNEGDQADSAQVSGNKKTYDDSAQAFEKQVVQDSVQGKKWGSDLQKIVEKWDDLPEHVKQTIRMLVDSAAKKSEES